MPRSLGVAVGVYSGASASSSTSLRLFRYSSCASTSTAARSMVVLPCRSSSVMMAATVPGVFAAPTRSWLSRLLGPGLRHRDGSPRRHLWRRGGVARSPVAHPPPLAPRHARPVRIRVPVLPARLPRAVARLVKHGRARRARLLRRVRLLRRHRRRRRLVWRGGRRPGLLRDGVDAHHLHSARKVPRGVRQAEDVRGPLQASLARAADRAALPARLAARRRRRRRRRGGAQRPRRRLAHGRRGAGAAGRSAAGRRRGGARLVRGERAHGDGRAGARPQGGGRAGDRRHAQLLGRALGARGRRRQRDGARQDHEGRVGRADAAAGRAGLRRPHLVRLRAGGGRARPPHVGELGGPPLARAAARPVDARMAPRLVARLHVWLRRARHRLPVRDGARHAHRRDGRHRRRRRARHPLQGRRRARGGLARHRRRL
mmetsp:Transcript_46962/g.151588  ORF Transcript_46962/g.151588 Transcript_46962/m.151588 type:complete len:430 (+) Transcript_46962:1055-2344(+)